MAAAEHTSDEEQIFQNAATLPFAERLAYLDSACQGKPALRAAVEQLLAGAEDADFMERAVDRTATLDFQSRVVGCKPEAPGEKIGAYKLLQPIGEGGFGVVWMAEQEKPVRRRVALKIIKLGMDTKEVVARFEQERQALAMMDHPSIARVFDAGATSLGRPYFVMELVQGVKITHYCDEANLSTRDRLQLFIAVCHAIQHAHQKGIIHRDLKPSNILVTLHDGVAVPKVIDFGVAKATQQQRLTDLTLFTHFEQMIGTPLYMSPEQAERSGLDIDTRSDIYSLGVLVYELLTGRTPFDPEKLMKAGIDEVRRVIREEEPQKPSTFLSTMAVDRRKLIAHHRQADPGKLVEHIRGDLDWIVLKALEKDRDRRYENASALARDIERYLKNEPVLARSASASYRFRRFVKRNRVIFAAGLAIVVSVITGMAVSISQALRARHEADRANAALADLRGSAPAFADQARGLVARERFDEAIEKLDYAIKLQPDSTEYLLAKADLLESQLRFSEAAAFYRAAAGKDSLARRAVYHAELCEKLAREEGSHGKLSRESMAELFAKMDQEHRSAAELMRIGRLLGNEQALLLTYWIERLQSLPIPPEKPLRNRLTMREDGLLALDLSGTRITDLKALEGMPLGRLDCTGCEPLTDISVLRGMPLRQLFLGNSNVSDISPIAGLRNLEELDITTTKVTSIEPLSAAAIRSLKMAKVGVEDLSPLRRLPIEDLVIDRTRVINLQPLSALPLKRLSADAIPAVDFSPLSELPLEFFSLRQTRCYDLAFLRKMPLRELYLTGCFAGNSLVLSEIPTLELLALPERFRVVTELGIPALREHARIRRLGFEPSDGEQVGLLPTAEEFWKAWDREGTVIEKFRAAGIQVAIKVLADQTWEVSFDKQPLQDLSPLRGSPVSKLFLRRTNITDLRSIAGMYLRTLSIEGTKIEDLTPLTGMPLEELDLNETAVADLNPIRGMKLRLLGIEQTKISDLSPLRGMPLETLWAGTTMISDLSPLRGMPIRILQIDDCPRLTDLSPLVEVPTLEEVFLPTTASNVQVLRALPRVKFISFDLDRKANRPLHTAEEFWSMERPTKEENLSRGQNLTELQRLIRSRLEHHTSTDVWRDYLKLMALAIALKDRAAYEELCGEIQQGIPGLDAELLLKGGCWVSPCGISEDTMRASLNDLKSAYGDTPKLRTSLKIIYALCEYRLGLWDQAERRLAEPPPFTSYEAAVAHTLRALIEYQRANLEGARLELSEARVICEKGWPTEEPAAEVPRNVGRWHEWLLANVLLKEAEDLTVGGSVPGRPK